MLLIGAVSVVAAGSLGGTAYALSTSSSGSSSTPAPAVAPKDPAHGTAHWRRRSPGLVARLAHMAEHAIHAQVIVPSKGGFDTYTFDRGIVTSVSSTSLSMKEVDGTSVVEPITSATKVLPATVGGIAGVHDGEHVVAVAENGATKLVWVPGAKPTKVRGTVTSVSSTGITVTKPKGKSVSEAVTSATKVLPASEGGISGVRDGDHVVITEVAGNARVIRVLLPHAPAGNTGNTGSAGNSGRAPAGPGG